jgi:uncharacterized protein (TIGR02285 family)
MLAAFILGSILSSESSASDEITVLYSYKSLSNHLQNGSASSTNSKVATILFDDIDAKMNFEFLPYERLSNTLQQSTLDLDNAVCALFKLKTKEREQQYLFSQPLAFGPSQRLFMHKPLPEIPPELLDEDNRINSLPDLMNHYSHSQIILAKGRAYGEFIDSQIANINEAQIIYVNRNSGENLNARLLGYERADFSILFPEELNEIKEEKADINYYSFRIAGAPTVITSHIICNKSPQSEVFLEKVNAELTKLYQTQAFLEAHFTFLPEIEHQVVKEAIKEKSLSMAR